MRVWVTREELPDGPLSEALRAAGLCPVLEPVLTTRIVGDAREEILSLSEDDWLVLTSPRAVRLAARPARVSPCVAVVGESSAKLARSMGLRVEYVSPSSDSRALWKRLTVLGQGRTVCFPRSSRAAVPRLPGARLLAPVIYEVETRCFSHDVVNRSDLTAFCSPSAVTGVIQQLGSVPLPSAAIGGTTGRALQEVGAPVLVQSGSPTFRAFARAIADAVRREGKASRASKRHEAS